MKSLEITMKSPCADPQFLPRNRSWCPELPSLNHAAVVSMMPLHRAVDTEVRRRWNAGEMMGSKSWYINLGKL